LAAALSPAGAQDIRGLELCTAEKQMDRRTGCLQANVEFLQQALAKQARESNEKLVAAQRDLATARGEIAALKAALTKIEGDVAQLKAKAEPAKK
jgi:chromosome segregation ATPase